MQMGRVQAEDSDSRLAQRLQEEFNSSSGARPKRSAASEAKKRLAEVESHLSNLKKLNSHTLSNSKSSAIKRLCCFCGRFSALGAKQVTLGPSA